MAARSGLKIRSTISPYEARLLRNAEMKIARSKDRQTSRFRAMAKYPMTAPRRVAKAGELKGVDTVLSTDVITPGTPIISTTNTNEDIILVNGTQAGTGSWQRIGRKITNRSLRIMGVLTHTVTTSAGNNTIPNQMIRMTVLWDQQTNSSAPPTFDTIFGITNDSGVESCPDITCPLKYDYMSRFKVIRDCWYDFDPMETAVATASAGTGVSRVSINEFIKFPNNIETIYSGTSSPAASTDISTGAIYVIFRGKVSQVGVASTHFNGIARLRYTDD